MARLPVLSEWPVVRQIRARDAGGLGATTASDRTRALQPRTTTADRVAETASMPSPPEVDATGKTSGKERHDGSGV